MANPKYHDGILPRWADFLSQLVVIYSIVTFTIESEPELAGATFFYWSEVCVTVFFAVEYFSRLFLARDKLRYVFSFYGVVDALATFPMILTFGFDKNSNIMLHSCLHLQHREQHPDSEALLLLWCWH